MRAGEILKLEHSWIDGRVIHLPADATKTSTRRDVALSLDAARLIDLAIKAKKTTSPKIFEGLTDKNRDALWRKARDRAGLGPLRDSQGRESTKAKMTDWRRLSGTETPSHPVAAFKRSISSSVATRSL